MRWLRYTAWLCSVAVASIVIALISAALQRAGLTPLLLSSLLIGAASGAATCGGAWLFSIEGRRMLAAGALAGAMLLVAIQHVALYRTSVHGWEQAQREQPELALFREPPPPDLWTYLRQEAGDGRAWLWLLDGAIVTATAAGVAAGLRVRIREANMEAEQHNE